MTAKRNLNQHAAMMNRMAQLLGLDLSDAMTQGRLSGEDWKDALIRCTGCAEPDTCTILLSEHDHDPHGRAALEEAPHYCANRYMMARLRDQMADETTETVDSEGVA